ncbi:phage tail sheath subtilisin-like domain-containing protein [Achromobacter xylosoxidans]
MAEIQLYEIPESTRKPGVHLEFNTRLARNSLPTNEQRVLIYGQRLDSGWTPALKIMDVFNDKDAAVYFGAGSIAHRMVIAAIEANPNAQISVIAVDDDVSGMAAEWRIDFPAAGQTAAGVLTVEIGKESVSVALEVGMNGGDIAYAIIDAISGRPDLPVRVASVTDSKMTTGGVSFQAKHKGEAGRHIQIAVVTRYSTGRSNTVRLQTVRGDSDPDLRPAYAAAFGTSHEIRVCPFATKEALLAFRSHLEELGSPMEQRDAIGIAGTPGTLAAATTVAGNINCRIMSLGWYNKSKCTDGEIAAGYAAVMAGEEHPARPLNTLPIKGLDIASQEDRPGRKEQESALHNGVTPIVAGSDNRARIVRAISTYLVDAQGITDDTCLDITVFRTLHYFRKACRQAVAQRFPRELLSDKTPPKVRTVILEVAYACQDMEILQNIDQYKDQLVVQKHDHNKGMCVAAIPAPIVHGMHVFAGRIDLIV